MTKAQMTITNMDEDGIDVTFNSPEDEARFNIQLRGTTTTLDWIRRHYKDAKNRWFPSGVELIKESEKCEGFRIEKIPYYKLAVLMNELDIPWERHLDHAQALGEEIITAVPYNGWGTLRVSLLEAERILRYVVTVDACKISKILEMDIQLPAADVPMHHYNDARIFDITVRGALPDPWRDAFMWLVLDVVPRTYYGAPYLDLPEDLLPLISWGRGMLIFQKDEEKTAALIHELTTIRAFLRTYMEEVDELALRVQLMDVMARRELSRILRAMMLSHDPLQSFGVLEADYDKLCALFSDPRQKNCAWLSCHPSEVVKCDPKGKVAITMLAPHFFQMQYRLGDMLGPVMGTLTVLVNQPTEHCLVPHFPISGEVRLRLKVEQKYQPDHETPFLVRDLMPLYAAMLRAVIDPARTEYLQECTYRP